MRKFAHFRLPRRKLVWLMHQADKRFNRDIEIIERVLFLIIERQSFNYKDTRVSISGDVVVDNEWYTILT